MFAYNGVQNLRVRHEKWRASEDADGNEFDDSFESVVSSKISKAWERVLDHRPWRHTVDSAGVSGWPQRCVPVALDLCRGNMSHAVEAVVHKPAGDLGLEEFRDKRSASTIPVSIRQSASASLSIHRRSNRPTTHAWLLVIADTKNVFVDTKRPWSLTRFKMLPSST
jgi:hypothetical protein